MANPSPTENVSLGNQPAVRARWWQWELASPVDEATQRLRVRRFYKWSFWYFVGSVAFGAAGIYWHVLSIERSFCYFGLGLLLTREKLQNQHSSPRPLLFFWILILMILIPGVPTDGGNHLDFYHYHPFLVDKLYAVLAGLSFGSCLIAGSSFLCWLFREPFLHYIETAPVSVSSTYPNEKPDITIKRPVPLVTTPAQKFDY